MVHRHHELISPLLASGAQSPRASNERALPSGPYSRKKSRLLSRPLAASSEGTLPSLRASWRLQTACPILVPSARALQQLMPYEMMADGSRSTRISNCSSLGSSSSNPAGDRWLLCVRGSQSGVLSPLDTHLQVRRLRCNERGSELDFADDSTATSCGVSMCVCLT
eukprot:CAMPEP_0174736510 /NCGR_PEP_ID=MMETSP1094-20130205/66780_1 /TAXON_ID=156173 /ORGANISM="Chrysochromulina brevifilum, Strain UTEX LB 985" /LENGTH=165 /DNA_ID=CAMNT_0015939617 /DNA_START=693 /DNA_END=1186 /DNA_ORIENTATION=+